MYLNKKVLEYTYYYIIVLLKKNNIPVHFIKNIGFKYYNYICIQNNLFEFTTPEHKFKG